MESKQYTVIYTENWMSGCHHQVLPCMKYVTTLPGEKLSDALERENIYNLNFIFIGHSVLETEGE